LLAVNGETRPDHKVGRNIPLLLILEGRGRFCP
jgi:hypothetical protein